MFLCPLGGINIHKCTRPLLKFRMEASTNAWLLAAGFAGDRRCLPFLVCFFVCLYVFNSNALQMRPVDGFSRVMAPPTTLTH